MLWFEAGWSFVLFSISLAAQTRDLEMKLKITECGSLQSCNWWPVKTGSALRMRRKTRPAIRSAPKPSHEDNIMARRATAAAEPFNGASIMLMKLPVCLDIEKKK